MRPDSIVTTDGAEIQRMGDRIAELEAALAVAARVYTRLSNVRLPGDAAGDLVHANETIRRALRADASNGLTAKVPHTPLRCDVCRQQAIRIAELEAALRPILDAFDQDYGKFEGTGDASSHNEPLWTDHAGNPSAFDYRMFRAARALGASCGLDVPLVNSDGAGFPEKITGSHEGCLASIKGVCDRCGAGSFALSDIKDEWLCPDCKISKS